MTQTARALGPTKPATPLASGGLGLTRAEWEGLYGRQLDSYAGVGVYRREGVRLHVQFFRQEGPETVRSIAREFDPPIGIDEAREYSKPYLPSDSSFLGTFEADPGDLIVDDYTSSWLVDRYPGGRGSRSHPWNATDPGAHMMRFETRDGSVVLEVTIATGNHTGQ
jgi:hypothetical protein